MDANFKEQIFDIAKEASLSEERTQIIIDGLNDDKGLCEEMSYYLEKNDFLCNTKVAGFSIVDILIWQIDHFRAFLDRDTTLTRNNPRTMALLAIETMINLKTNPEKYVREYSQETGTDQII